MLACFGSLSPATLQIMQHQLPRHMPHYICCDEPTTPLGIPKRPRTHALAVTVHFMHDSAVDTNLARQACYNTYNVIVIIIMLTNDQ